MRTPTWRIRNTASLLRWLEPIREALACWRKIQDSRPLSQQKIAFIRLISARLINVFSPRLELLAGLKTQPNFKSP